MLYHLEPTLTAKSLGYVVQAFKEPGDEGTTQVSREGAPALCTGACSPQLGVLMMKYDPFAFPRLQ